MRLSALGEDVCAEQGFGFALAPTLYLVFGAQELHVRVSAQVEQDLIRAAIEFLREGDQGFGAPLDIVRGTPDGNVQAFLFNDASDAESEEDQSATGLSQVYVGADAGLADGRFRK